MTKANAWSTVVVASTAAGTLLVPIAMIAGWAALVVSAVVIPCFVSFVVWRRTPGMLDSGILLFPAASISSLLGVAVGFLFFCNVNSVIAVCAK